MKSKFAGYLVVLVSLIIGALAFLLFEHINETHFSGVYGLGAFLAAALGLIPSLVYDLVKNKKAGSGVMTVLLVFTVGVLFYATMPRYTYADAMEDVSSEYQNVISSAADVESENSNRVNSFVVYSSGYVFETSENGQTFYVVVNPRTGDNEVIRTQNGKIA